MSKSRVRFWLLAVAVAAICCATGLAAQEEMPEMPEMTPEMQAEMAAWMELAQPGDCHKHLDPFVGKWKGKVEMWMDPEGEPMLNESQAEVSWMMGGRFLVWKQTGDFGGMPWEGMSIEGYNNGDKRYESIWMDNFGTLMLPFHGACSEDGKRREMLSEFNDVVAGGTIKYKGIYTWIDDDHFTYETFMDRGEGEFKNMVIHYERQ